MRVGLLLSGLALCLPANAPAQPDPILYLATVTQPQALVRSQPSDAPQVYATNTLQRGAVVKVVKQEGDGWLKILPPEGSFSWINKRFVHQPSLNNPTWVVTAARDAKVPVLIGSDQKGVGRPTTRGAILSRGAIVVSIGPPQTDEEGSWLPIEPPPGEYRYIRADAVVRSDAPVSAGPSAPVGPSPFNPARPETLTNLQQPALNIPNPQQGSVKSAVGAGNLGKVEQIWGEAVQAERAGRVAEAILLYTQVGTEGAGTNHDLAMQALNRAYWLRQAGRNPNVAGQPGGAMVSNPTPPTPNPGTAASVAGGSRFTPTPTTNPAPTPNQESTTTTNRPSSVGGHPWTTPPGILRFSEQRILPGRRVYLLMTRDERPISYVTAGFGVDLEPYLNREVELVGKAVFRSDLKTNLMVVERVQVSR